MEPQKAVKPEFLEALTQRIMTDYRQLGVAINDR